MTPLELEVQLRIEQQDYLMAIVLLEQHLDRSPEDIDTYIHLGEVHLKIQNYMSALLVLAQCKDLGHYSIDVEEKYIDCLFETHQFDMCAKHIEETLESYPQRAHLWRLKGYLLDRQKQPEAQSAFIKAHHLIPELYPIPQPWPMESIFEQALNLLPEHIRQDFTQEVIFKDYPSQAFLSSQIALESPLLTFSLTNTSITLYLGNLRYTSEHQTSVDLLSADLLHYWCSIQEAIE